MLLLDISHTPLSMSASLQQPGKSYNFLVTVMIRGAIEKIRHTFFSTFDPLLPSVTQWHTFDYPRKNYITYSTPPRMTKTGSRKNNEKISLLSLFLPRDASGQRGYEIACGLSVCQSVRL